MEVAGYFLIYICGSGFLYLTNGVEAMQWIDPAYPWDDTYYIPSLFYRFGWAEHTERKSYYIEVDSEEAAESTEGESEETDGFEFGF